MGENAWVTLATNDSYALGALVLGHSLKNVGTRHKLAVMVTPGVTQPMRDQLKNVFNVVTEVNVLDSRDEANLALLSRPELGVTFTKLHCWRLTEFSKCVFLDADTLVLQNCDELFDREELSAAPDAGWPDCFNSGVFVYRPSLDTFKALVDFAVAKGSFDGGDQGLLNLFFKDWATQDISRHLPFIYNVCSTATYSYLPAFKQFASEVKILHFIGPNKPWLLHFDTVTRQVHPPTGSEHLLPLLQLWWNIFCNNVHPSLTSDMDQGTAPVSYFVADLIHRLEIPHASPNASYLEQNVDPTYEFWDPWETYIPPPSVSQEQQTYIVHHEHVNDTSSHHQHINTQNDTSSHHQHINTQNDTSSHHQHINTQNDTSSHHQHINTQNETCQHQTLVQHHNFHQFSNNCCPVSETSNNTQLSHNYFQNDQSFTDSYPVSHSHHQTPSFHHTSFVNTESATLDIHSSISDHHHFHQVQNRNSEPFQQHSHPQHSESFEYRQSAYEEGGIGHQNQMHERQVDDSSISQDIPNHNHSSSANYLDPLHSSNLEHTNTDTHYEVCSECVRLTNETEYLSDASAAPNERRHSNQQETGLAGAFAKLTLGVPRTAEQAALEEHMRKQAWEQGNIDYLGADSFDNIWKKISETLASGPKSGVSGPQGRRKSPSPVPATQLSSSAKETESAATSGELDPGCEIKPEDSLTKASQVVSAEASLGVGAVSSTCEHVHTSLTDSHKLSDRAQYTSVDEKPIKSETAVTDQDSVSLPSSESIISLSLSDGKGGFEQPSDLQSIPVTQTTGTKIPVTDSHGIPIVATEVSVSHKEIPKSPSDIKDVKTVLSQDDKPVSQLKDDPLSHTSEEVLLPSVQEISKQTQDVPKNLQEPLKQYQETSKLPTEETHTPVPFEESSKLPHSQDDPKLLLVYEAPRMSPVQETSKLSPVEGTSKSQSVQEALKAQPVKESPKLQPVQEPPKPQTVQEAPKPQTVQEAPMQQPVQEVPKSQPLQEVPKPQPVQEAFIPQPVQEAPKPQPVQEAPKPQPVQEAPKPQPVQEAPKPQPVQEAPKPQPVQEAPKPQPVQEAPKPQPVQEAPKPQPVQEAPKPQPVQEAPKPQPVQEAPKPQPVQEAPKPQPVQEAPKPQPVQEAPKPQPVQEAPKPQPVQEAPKPQPVQEAPKSQPVQEAGKPQLVEKGQKKQSTLRQSSTGAVSKSAVASQTDTKSASPTVEAQKPPFSAYETPTSTSCLAQDVTKDSPPEQAPIPPKRKGGSKGTGSDSKSSSSVASKQGKPGGKGKK